MSIIMLIVLGGVVLIGLAIAIIALVFFLNKT